MKPSAIAPEEIPAGASLVRIGAPQGRTDIEGVDALITVDQQGGPQMILRIALDDGDLERLAAAGHWWLAILSDHMHPVAFVLPRGAQGPLIVPPGVQEIATLRAQLDQERARIRELLMLALIQADALADLVDHTEERATTAAPRRRAGVVLDLTREVIAPPGKEPIPPAGAE